jgi:endonuclease-3 related protein
MPKVMEIYRLLFDHFGPQHWWPGDSAFEVIIGAILTQQTNWQNVEAAIENLKDAGYMDPVKIADAGKGKIEELVRPSGFFKQKTGYLKSFCEHLVNEFDSSLDMLFSKGLVELRRELLDLHGIGPETCDSILLYAGNKQTFVVDAYTIRICQRLGILRSGRYDAVKGFFEENTTPDIQIYKEFHALFVMLGKEYCRPKNPDCNNCPLGKDCQKSLQEENNNIPDNETENQSQ